MTYNTYTATLKQSSKADVQYCGVFITELKICVLHISTSCSISVKFHSNHIRNVEVVFTTNLSQYIQKNQRQKLTYRVTTVYCRSGFIHDYVI